MADGWRWAWASFPAPLAAGAAVLAAAAWLRTPWLPYLFLLLVATVLLAGRARSAIVADGVASAGVRAGLMALASAMFLVFALAQHRHLRQIDTNWEHYEWSSRARSAQLLERSLGASHAELTAAAHAALEAPVDAAQAFAALRPLVRGDGERAVLLADDSASVTLEDENAQFAWAGTVRVVPRLPAGSHLVQTPFYTILAVVAEAGSRTATATVMVDAAPPADRLAATLVGQVRGRSGAQHFDIAVVDSGTPPDPTAATLSLGEGRELRAVPAPLSAAEVRVLAAQSARIGAIALLGLLSVAFVLLVWPTHGLAGRGWVLATAFATLGLVPFNEASNFTRWFDPTVYFAGVGGPWTGSVGVLASTGVVLLLGVLFGLQHMRGKWSRPTALTLVVAIVIVAPILMRRFADGITAPGSGVTTPLWISYQMTLFLVGTALLVSLAGAGRALAGRYAALPPWAGPSIALAAAFLAPVLWSGPGSWPSWYMVVWVAAIVVLALTRQARWLVVSSALVAGLGSAVLVWGSLARERADRAVQEVAALDETDAAAEQLLERFAMDLASAPAPSNGPELLRAYVASDLASADYPVTLAAWRANGTLADSLMLWSMGDSPRLARDAADTARVTGQAVLSLRTGAPGIRMVLAVPHEQGGVTTVVTAPASRLFPADPYITLLALRPPDEAEPGYALALNRPRVGESHDLSEPVWTRSGDELHADWIAQLDGQSWRVHAEVELRGLGALVPRATLLLLANLAMVMLIWSVSVLGDGTISRWFERRRKRWARSYRVRLSLVLFAFFVVPAGAFALWSSRRLRSDEMQSRALLVAETLRVAEGNLAAGTLDALRGSSPILVYSHGELRTSNDRVISELAPAGTLLPPDVHLDLEHDGEPSTTMVHDIAGVPVLFGSRMATMPTGAAVAAAPARGDDTTIQRRGRDVAYLVLFATVMGALAALWLSGVAAREFARPISALRRAALAVARGRREPELPGSPPSEFQPVFAAFRAMDADLRASREALEAAQRRTSAVLRTVASGVVAVDNSGVVTLANPAANALFGARLVPSTPLDQSPAAPVAAVVREFLNSGQDEQEFDVSLGVRQIHARLSVLSAGAGGAVLTLEDVTELARAQRVLAWGEMARQVAHEIKNPLTPIRLGVQHLRRAYNDGRVDYAAVLDQNVGRILNEIDHLDEIARAFSRYGTAPEDREAAEPVDITSVARDVMELERMGESDVVWVLAEPDARVVAMARADELREVLLNVLENARLAGASTVEMRVTGRSDGSGAAIVVVDDGHGIASDVLPRIFEPHFSTRTSGSGLGLAISRRMVEAWGGALTVDSEPGQGATVTLTLAPAGTERQH